MKYLMSVPQPCHESWADMTPEGNGRHCMKCSKVVTDFTNWEQQDILAYIKANSATGVCGRFRAEQLDTIEVDTFVQAVSYSRLSLSRSVAAILLAAIGIIAVSCNTGNSSPTQTLTQQPTTGVASIPMPPPPPSSTQYIDTAKPTEGMLGEVEMKPIAKPKIKMHHRHEAPPIIAPEEPDIIVGKLTGVPVIMEPDTTQKK